MQTTPYKKSVQILGQIPQAAGSGERALVSAGEASQLESDCSAGVHC